MTKKIDPVLAGEVSDDGELVFSSIFVSSPTVRIHGNDVWKAIGKAFPTLHIWFVGENEIKKFTWNDAYDAVSTK